MPQIDDTGGSDPHHDADNTANVGDAIPAGRKRRSATPNGLRRREFERLQLLCRLDLPMRQFLPAILPYLRELVPASCAFVIWSDRQGNTALLRESPRAIALETQTPRACEVHYALQEYFSGAAQGRRRCGLIPLHVLGLDEAACAYRPAIAAVLAVKLERLARLERISVPVPQCSRAAFLRYAASDVGEIDGGICAGIEL